MDTSRRLKSNKGITIVFVALTIVVIVAFVGIAVDIGYMYVAKQQLQNAADAAALAGAQLLDGTNGTTQDAARAEAIKFAQANKAADSPVAVASKRNSNNLSPITQDTGNSNDITFGNWDPTQTDVYSTTRTPVNAIQVRARRTVLDTSSPRRQVTIFFSKILGWARMSASATAVAAIVPGFSTPALTICINSCPAVTGDYVLQPTTPGISNGIAWTTFQNTPSVPASEIRKYVDGRLKAPNDICDKCLTTNNGVTEPLIELADLFANPTFDAKNKDFDPVNKSKVIRWRVGVPILDVSCNSPFTSACPPGLQGGPHEPYHVSGIAQIAITAVTKTGSVKGITIDGITCRTCPATWTDLFPASGSQSKLVNF